MKPLVIAPAAQRDENANQMLSAWIEARSLVAHIESMTGLIFSEHN
jgi:hypothetical protein